MTYVTRKYVDILGSWKKKYVPLGCFLCKKITKKHFVRLKTCYMSHKPFLLIHLVLITRLVAKNTSVKNVTWGTDADLRWAHATHIHKSFDCANFTYLLKGEIIKYGLNSFYNWREGCLLIKNVWLNKHMFYDAKQPTVCLAISTA